MITTNTPLRRIAAAAFALAAAATVGFGTVATAAPALAAPVSAPMRTQLAPADLDAKLRLVVNTGADRGARAAELEAGEAGLPLADQIAGAMAAAPPSFRWSVLGPVTVNGDILNAQLQTAVDGYDPFYFNLTWKQIDGTWKLTREAQCTLASVAFLPCSV